MSDAALVEQFLKGTTDPEADLTPETPVDELDTSDGTPDDTVDTDAEVGDTKAGADEDDKDPDTDDGTPEDDDEPVSEYELRFKDTQAKLTETSQELADLRSEYADEAGSLTDAQFALKERADEVEQMAGFFANMSQQNLQQLRQVNVQQLTQEQYANWQQQVNAATTHAAQLDQFIGQAKEQTQKAKDTAMGREVAVSRAQLSKRIPNFDEVYPDIGKFAAANGVNPRVFRDITDPGLILLLHQGMVASNQPDVIEEVSRRTATKKRPANRQQGDPGRNQPKSLAERLYGNK